jgi:hypothetical protein
MNAIEFDAQLTSGDRIQVPLEVARELPESARIRVILLWETGEDEEWRKLTSERFAAAYAPEDSVYEQLIDEPPSR